MVRVMRLVLLGLLVAYPVVVVVLATSTGVLLSQDSVSYLAAARSFAAGHGLTSFDGQPLTLFPPGLSIILGTVEGLGVSAETAAVALNAACVGLVVLATYQLGRLALRSSWPALVSAAVVSLSAPFTLSFVWLWSEPLFTVMAAGLLLLLMWAIRRARCPWWVVVLSGLAVGSLISVRYVGYTLLPVAAVGIWWASRPARASTDRVPAVVRVLVVLGLGLVVPAIIAMRNIAVGSGPLGDRYPGVRTLLDSVTEAVGVLGAFLYPAGASGATVVVGSIVALLVLVGVWAGLIDRDRALLLLGIFAFLYVAAIVWSQTATRLDPPTPRLLTPAVPALAVLTIAGVRVVLRRMLRDVRGWTSSSGSAMIRARGASVAVGVGWSLLAAMTAALLIASMRADVRMLDDARSGSLGLRASAAASPLAAEGLTLPGATGFASNDPWRIYLAVGSSPVVFLPPSTDEWPQARIDRDLSLLKQAVQDGTVTHALVVEQGSSVLPWSEVASSGLEAELVATTPEGAIYRLTAAG